jgi:hypothetical protein
MEASAASAEREEFMPIVDWVGGERSPEVSADRKVIDLTQTRWSEMTRPALLRPELNGASRPG